MELLVDHFLSQYGKRFAIASHRKNSIPFKDHPQLSLVFDILARKNCHHVLFHHTYSKKFQHTFWEALLLYFQQEHIPLGLQAGELFELNFDTMVTFEAHTLKSFEDDLQTLCEHLNERDQYLFITLSQHDLLTSTPKTSEHFFLQQQLHKLLVHPKIRFLLFMSPNENKKIVDDQFATLKLNPPTENDVLALLRQERTELEQYHHVVIPEELLLQAYQYAGRYLSTAHALEKSILLLDTSAVHTQLLENSDSMTSRPVLSLQTMLSVLSSWTQIPNTHLSLNQFKATEFFQGMQQRIYGQDAALSVIQHELKQAHSQLRIKRGPFCSFLFTGPQHTGKKTTALALIEQLFKQLNVLHIVHLNQDADTHFLQLSVRRYTERESIRLEQALEETPHAVFLLENIEQAPSAVLHALEELFNTGFVRDQVGKFYDFRQSILILTSTLGSSLLSQQATLKSNEHGELNLMQLLASEYNDPSPLTQQSSAHEVVQAILPELRAQLPETLCNRTAVVPFLALAQASIEKIIRLKLKVLCKQLDSRYGIELGYAPEVVHYLTTEVFKKKSSKQKLSADIPNANQAIKQLYLCVEQALQSQIDPTNRSNQLFLQLNENGQLLRCDWLLLTGGRQHAL